MPGGASGMSTPLFTNVDCLGVEVPDLDGNVTGVTKRVLAG